MNHAQVYLNDAPVRGIDHARELRIEDLLRAYGMDPKDCDVFRLRSREDRRGEPVNARDQVPREGAVYYRAVPRGSPSTEGEHGANPGSHQSVPQARGDAGQEGRGESTPEASAEARRRNVTLGSEIRRPVERKRDDDADAEKTET